MFKSEHIPRATVHRLAIYVQVLERLPLEGRKVVSSETLAKACEVSPSQIRKDLAYFGEFGVRGIGYYVEDLKKAIKSSLGIDRTWNVALVGIGNLGRSLLRHNEFRRSGFIIVGAFDCDPFKIGEVVADLEVFCTRRLKDKVKELNIEIGMISTPSERAQRAANHMIKAGIKGIVNFAPARIHVPEHISVEYVDFVHHLYSLAFNISFGKSDECA